MELTQAEKDKILAEEKVRFEARKELEKPAQKENAKQLGMIFAVLAVLYFFWQYILMPYIVPMLQENGF